MIMVVPELPSDRRATRPQSLSHTFRDALSAALRAPIQIIEVASHAGLYAALDGLAADIVWAPPLVAQSFVREGKASPVAAAVRGGRTSYPAVIVSRTDSGLRLGRARPLSVALASPLSAGGDRVARLFLAAVGQRVSETRHLGSHDAVVAAVAAGTMDIGATYGRLDEGDELVRLPHALPGVHVCAIAGFVPSDSVVLRHELLESLARPLADALLSLRTSDLGPLHEDLGVESFREVDARHLAPLSQLSHLASGAAQSPSLQRRIAAAG